MTELSEQRLLRLVEVGRSLVSQLDLETVLRHVLEAARELTDARYAALGILDDRRTELERFLTSGIDEETHRRIGALPRGRGVLGELIRDPKPLRLADVGKHPRSYGFPLAHPPMTSFLGVPILIRGVAYGNLYLGDRNDGGEFSEADEQALVVLADWAAVAIDNAHAYRLVDSRRDELERALASFEAMTEIASAVAGETDLTRVLELVVKRARALTDARAAAVMLLQDSEVVVAAVAGELDAEVIGESVPVKGSLAGQALEQGVPVRLDEATPQVRPILAERAHAEAGLVVPLRVRGRSVGVLVVLDRLEDGPHFTSTDENLLTGFALSAALAVETARTVTAETLRLRLRASERERARWARELHDSTLQELAAVKLLLASARSAAGDVDRDEAIAAAAAQVDVAVGELRALVTDLRSPTLDARGVEAALDALIARTGQAAAIDVRLDVDLAWERGRSETRLAPDLESTVYRVVQEALANVMKHAGASKATVSVSEDAEFLEIVVADDGVGFAGTRPEGFGLTGIQERVELVGGEFDVRSEPSAGTTIRARLPVSRTDSDTGSAQPRTASASRSAEAR
jgi:signal transduction histidine kinase